MSLDLGSIAQHTANVLTQVGLKTLGAIVLFVVGRWLIRFTTSLAARALNRQNLDTTVVGYIRSNFGVLLNAVLIVALFGVFGVQTATLAALLAGVGIAIGGLGVDCCLILLPVCSS